MRGEELEVAWEGRKEESSKSAYRPCLSLPSFPVVRPLEPTRHLLRGTPPTLPFPSRRSGAEETETAVSERNEKASHSLESTPRHGSYSFELISTHCSRPSFSTSPLIESRSYPIRIQRVRRRQTSRTISRRLPHWRPTFFHPSFSLSTSIHLTCLDHTHHRAPKCFRRMMTAHR